MTNEVEMVPLAAHEAQCERFAKIIRYMIVGWTITAVTLAFMLLISFSYEEEVVTETETIQRIAEADHLGNAIVGDGDISIGDSTANNYEDEIDDDA